MSPGCSTRSGATLFTASACKPASLSSAITAAIARGNPGVPATVYGARGAGSNTILISPDHDLVVVWRWHAGNEAELAKRVIAAIK